MSNYQSAPNWANLECLEGSEGQKYVKIYNNSTALANGTIKVLSYLVDATDTDNPIIKGIGVAPSTNADSCNVILVVDNSPKGLTTIPASSYGWACVKGYTIAYVDATSADVAVGDQLEVITTGTAFIGAGAVASSGVGTIPINVCAAIAMEAYTANEAALKKVCLLGNPVVIAGS